MDLASLKEAAANLTLYDIKAGVRKVQNAVMNYTEMEAKVREATNNEPWGCPSSQMQEIANATYNYQALNEIMPMIYKRFTEKAAEEWRQIYKALQLLEFLIKNGSERVIDDARSHLTLLKMLRQFHYTDQNGKDQGMNVRNRADELSKLLSDVDKIRAERKKARSNRSKYSGVEGGSGLGGASSSSRYGGFGSEESGGYGGYSGGVYGDGGGFGGQGSDFQDSGHHGELSPSSRTRRDRFDEYDEYDEGAVAAPGRRLADSSTASVSSRKKKPIDPAPKPTLADKREPEPDLFSFDDQVPISKPADEDDFDDFQFAAPSASASVPQNNNALPGPTTTTTSFTQYAAPQPVSAPNAANVNDLVGFSSTSPAPSNSASLANYSMVLPPINKNISTVTSLTQQVLPTGYQGSQPNYFTSVPAPGIQKSAVSSPTAAVNSPTTKASFSGDAFGSLWSTASVGIKKTGTSSSGPALGQLAKEKASAGIWGTGAPNLKSATQQQSKGGGQQSLGNGLDDLLG